MNSNYLEVPILDLPEIIPGKSIPVCIDPDQIYLLKFKDSEFLCTGCGSWSTHALYTSFAMEKQIREKWWNIQKGDYVFDIGSHYGSYTLTALAQGAEFVISVDPDRISFFDLETNLILNSFSQKCFHMNYMLGKEPGISDFYPISHSNRKEGDRIESRLVTTVDSIKTMLVLPKLDWIKIDVEGMELDVLEGAKETLQQFKPKLLIENHECFVPGITDKVKSFLIPFGYTEERDTSELGCWSFWENRHEN